MKRWRDENNRQTKEHCHKLLRALKEEHLEPILRELSGKDGELVTYAQILGCFAIEQGFKCDAKGAKDICTQVLHEFYPVGVCGICLDQLKTFKSVQCSRARYKQSSGQTIGKTNNRI